MLGDNVTILEGDLDGLLVGFREGIVVGMIGFSVGERVVGILVVGAFVGRLEGADVGFFVFNLVGFGVGFAVSDLLVGLPVPPFDVGLRVGVDDNSSIGPRAPPSPNFATSNLVYLNTLALLDSFTTPAGSLEYCIFGLLHILTLVSPSYEYAITVLSPLVPLLIM